MGIYLLVQKTVVHNFFADSAMYVSTATVHSSNGIKSLFYSNIDDDFFLHRWNFRLNTICRSLRNGDLFTCPKDYCSQFFADSAKYVSTALVHSSNGIKSFFYSNDDDNFSLNRWNFRLNTICRSLRNGIYLLVQKTFVHNFLRIPQSTFPLLQSTVQMESSRSSTQTLTTTFSYIVETFV